MKAQGNLSSGSVPAAFLNIDGEMSRLVSAFHWESTPLGPIETWPQSLRTAVGLLLGSKFPMFLWWGPEFICFYNDAYRPSLGQSGKHPSILGQKGAKAWVENWHLLHPSIARIMAGGPSTWSEDQRIPLFRNGAIDDAWWTYSFSPVMDESGLPAGVLSTNFETTQKVINLRELQISDQRFQNLIRDANVGIIVLIGEDYLVAVVNEAYGRLIERRPSELLGQPLFDIIPDAQDPFRKMLDSVRLTGESVYLYAHPYLVYTHGKKIEGFLDVVYQPYREADGTITGVMAIVHNVTERTLARKKLEEAEAKARLAIESADLGTYEINLQTDDMTTSERFNKIWGIAHAMHRTKIVDRIHADDRELRLKAHRDSLTNGHIDYEARVIWEDRSEHWVKVKGKVLYDTQNKPTTLVGVVQDITAQKESAAQLTQQVDERTIELQRSNDDLLQFAHVITHDLKEPVRKIKIYTSRIKEETGAELPARITAFLDKIQHATDRMFDMIEGVLDYSAISAIHEHFEPVDLNGIIRDVQTDLELVIQQKSATMNIGPLPVIHGAAILIHQLFFNLVNNSLKFTRKDIPPVVTIAAAPSREQGRGFALITVRDNGIGFDQEHAESIFTTFARLNSKDLFEGTGLGLALSKKIVERHGGSISAQSRLGEGATFIIKLPLEHSTDRSQ